MDHPVCHYIVEGCCGDIRRRAAGPRHGGRSPAEAAQGKQNPGCGSGSAKYGRIRIRFSKSWSDLDPICNLMSDPVYKLWLDPDPVYKQWSDPVSKIWSNQDPVCKL